MTLRPVLWGRWRRFPAGAWFAIALVATAAAQSPSLDDISPLEDRGFRLPNLEQVLRLITLRDHNTRVVIIGVVLLGFAAGIVGSFLLLRKRSLMGDAISHATLPGVCIAYMAMTVWGGQGKFLPGLLLGAAVSGALGMGAVIAIQRLTRIKEDAALGIVLSVFFGLGVALLGMIQQMSTGQAAGLESFIYGKTASMLSSDACLIAIAAGVVVAVCLALFKEFGLLCFDQDFAGSQGWPVLRLDLVLMTLVVAVTVIGLQAVGLILVIALLIIPPAAARFWTNHLPTMVLTAALLGALSGLIGAGLSALQARLPAGAIIVLVATLIFLVSMFLGPARGVIARMRAHIHLKRKTRRQHLLRALYERTEPAEQNSENSPSSAHGATAAPVSFDALLAARSWTPATLRRALRATRRDGLVCHHSERHYELTEPGAIEARRVVRNHRLWELYLISHADIAPSHVDRNADRIEHVLDPAMITELEQLLAAEHAAAAMPVSPHVLPHVAGVEPA